MKPFRELPTGRPWQARRHLIEWPKQQGRRAMAKGQMRSNKEAKKPKKDKVKASPGGTTAAGFAKTSQPAGSPPKKK
jgi:hypothetical protein